MQTFWYFEKNKFQCLCLDEKKMESKEVIQRKIKNLEEILEKMIFKKLESDVVCI